MTIYVICMYVQQINKDIKLNEIKSLYEGLTCVGFTTAKMVTK